MDNKNDLKKLAEKINQPVKNITQEGKFTLVELEDGTIHQIIPPLQEDMTPEEFQEHYERAIAIIKSIKNSRSDNQDSQKLG